MGEADVGQLANKMRRREGEEVRAASLEEVPGAGLGRALSMEDGGGGEACSGGLGPEVRLCSSRKWGR